MQTESARILRARVSVALKASRQGSVVRELYYSRYTHVIFGNGYELLLHKIHVHANGFTFPMQET